MCNGFDVLISDLAIKISFSNTSSLVFVKVSQAWKVCNGFDLLISNLAKKISFLNTFRLAFIKIF